MALRNEAAMRAMLATKSEAFQIGYVAAREGDTRAWCAAFGEDCVAGWDAYWDAVDPDPVEN